MSPWLIDFSIASNYKCIQFLPPQVVEGTVAYISPEQTGKMNRGIDYRSDLYSLGVTFYQLLTGVLPFTSNDYKELIYYHLAISPISSSKVNQHIPKVIDDVITKLMAKNPDDRYQSALGLQYDLEQVKLLRETSPDKINSFVLGKKDISDRFLISEKLYGREEEVEILLRTFDKISCSINKDAIYTFSRCAWLSGCFGFH